MVGCCRWYCDGIVMGLSMLVCIIVECGDCLML